MVQVNPVTVEFENAPASPFEFIDNFNRQVFGDFNGDGLIDQAKIETYFPYAYASPDTTVSILLGDEDGNLRQYS